MTFLADCSTATQKPSAQMSGQILLQTSLLAEAQVRVAFQDQACCGARLGEFW